MERPSRLHYYGRLVSHLAYGVDRILVHPLMLGFGIRNVVIDGEENLENLGSALILPKHCYNADVPAIAYTLLRKGFEINYVSRKFNLLVDFVIAPLGARKIFQPGDVIKEISSYAKSNGFADRNKIMKKKRDIIVKARSFNEETLRSLQESYSKGEVVVSHPEHGKFRRSMGHILPDGVLRTTIMYYYGNKNISIVPVGVEYDRPPSFFLPANISIRFGKKISLDEFVNDGSFDEKGLVKRIRDDISSLSGFVSKS